MWEMKDSIMNLKHLPNSDDILQIAQNMELNIEQFRNDMQSLDLKSMLDLQYKNLSEQGIYAVPTILINGNLVFDPSSYIEIDGLIQNELTN
jgi:predicted DsbA family dithiol-disulfide isomerase